MEKQDPKDQKPLSDKELEQATGGMDEGGGGGKANLSAGSADNPDAADPGLAASGMDPDTYYAIYPASKPLPKPPTP